MQPRANVGKPIDASSDRPLVRILSAALPIYFGLAAVAIAHGPMFGPNNPVPANPDLEAHSNFFTPATLYDLDHYPTPDTPNPYQPAGLSYEVLTGVGYNLANSIFLVHRQSGEIVVVDTLGDTDSVNALLAELRPGYAERFGSRFAAPTNAPLPIAALVYTHNHIDHTGGVQGYLAAADRPVCPATALGQPTPAESAYTGREDCVEVISQYEVTDAVINTGTIVGNILNTRSGYMYGSYCDPFVGCIVNDGIGPKVEEGDSGFQLPSHTFDQQLRLTVAGLDFLLVYVPSETNDELMVFVADGRNAETGAKAASWSAGPGLLLSAEVIQGPSFPNLYSLRGTKFRSPATWYQSVDVLRQFDAWCMLPSHGPPLCGRESIRALLVNFRDAVQYTHDQTLRYMYRGMTPDELVEHIHLPDYLLDDLAEKVVPVNPETMNPRDYLRKFYGSVPQGVREIYNGYLGWYQADPVALRPTPPVELAKRMVELMGGPARVLAEAQKARESCTTDDVGTLGQCQWAAELTTLLIRIDHQNRDARQLEASAFEAMAEVELDPNWRNWYLSAALELRHVFDDLPGPSSGLVSAEIVGHLPPGAWVSSQSLLLKAESTMPAAGRAKVEMALAFTFTETAPEPTQRFVSKIDGAVARYIAVDDVAFDPRIADAAFEAAEVKITLTQATLLDLLREQAALIQSSEPADLGPLFTRFVDAGRITLQKGSAEDLETFFGYFDPRPAKLQPLTVR